MAKKQQDGLQRAKECYEDLRELWADNRVRMLEDLRFSNPVSPEQWDKTSLDTRKGRPCLTLDRTNQYVVQVVNGGRMNKPGINCMPADSGADVDVATALDGIIRHIEYRSRAQIAYDWALEGAARCGVGWLRVVPRVVDPASNLQEICIDRVADHLSCMIDGEQPDGSDAMNGFAETLIPKKRFKRLYPNASTRSWDGGGDGTWVVGDMVRVAEHQYVEETDTTMVAVKAPDNGEELHLTEAEFADLAARVGYVPEHRTYKAKSREVGWRTFNGDEILEETTLPGQYIGIVPVIGYELFVDGKRYICGVTRRLMESQRAYNYERSALVEAVALQPKAPIMVSDRAIDGHDKHYENLNSGQPAYLVYNDIDDQGPIAPPQRMSPPTFPAAFAQGGQMAVGDMEAAVGMYQANLGMPNNATSGRQERERKMQGDVATFHYADNQARSIEHLGRIVVGMIPAIYDTPRQAKILGIDGQQSTVDIDPKMETAARKQGKKVVAINPTVGRYDVRVKTGPGFTTQREEAAEGITAILQAAPQLTPILAPELARMRDWPNSEKIARALIAMAPPQVQAMLGEEDGEESAVPPQVMQQMQTMQQEGAQMAQMLDAAQAEIQRLTAELESKQADREAKLAEAQIDAQAKVTEAQIDAEARIREAAINAEGQAMVAQMQPQPVQPAPEAPEAPEAESPDALATLLPVLLSMQQQIGALTAPAQPMEIIHERDPATGLVIRSFERPLMH